MNNIPLTEEEEKAIKTLRRLGKTWPSSLILYGNGGQVSVRKPQGQFPGQQTEVTTIEGIKAEGGDGGDFE